jgi:hypothetical protein
VAIVGGDGFLATVTRLEAKPGILVRTHRRSLRFEVRSKLRELNLPTAINQASDSVAKLELERCRTVRRRLGYVGQRNDPYHLAM